MNSSYAIKQKYSSKKDFHALCKSLNIFMLALSILLMPLVAINLTLVAKTLCCPNQVPSVAGYTPLIITSESMSPAINIGDLVIVKKAIDSELKKGDIIAFKIDNTIVTHRIIRISTDSAGTTIYRTQGDTNNIDDGKNIPHDSVVGVYHKKIAGMGNVLLFLQSIYGIILIVFIASLWMALCIELEKNR